MGSKILSRSFQVEKWDGEVPRSGSVDPQAMQVDEENDSHNEPAAEVDDNSADSDSESDDEDDPADIAMVPMADMLNARYGSENAKLFYEERDLRMVTTKAIKEGEQIWNTYGDPPNSYLLRRYGHVDLVPMPDGRIGNPADIVEIRADFVVASISKLHASSASILEKVDWWLEEGGEDVFTLEVAGDIAEEMLSFVRLLLMLPAEWEKVQQKSKLPKPKKDAQVLGIIEDTLKRRFSGYPTTLEQDEVTLSDTSISLNKRHALVVRIGEKHILQATLQKLGTKVDRSQQKKRKAEDVQEKQLHKKR